MRKVNQYVDPKLRDRDYLSKLTAFDCLWESCKDHLNEVAITYKADINVLDRNKKTLSTIITYKELIKNIFKTYNALKNIGLKEGDVVTYASITTPELIYTMYACNLIGAIFDPIDPRLKEEDLLRHFKSEPSKLYFVTEKMFDATKNIYQDINAKNIITLSCTESLPSIIQFGSKILDKKNGVAPFSKPDDNRFLSWNDFFKNNNSKNVIVPKFEKNKIISYAHTTGTTGKSKTLEHTNENWNAQWHSIFNSGLEIIRGETFFNVTVPWVDFGLVVGIHANLCDGIRMDLDPTWTPEATADFFFKNRPDWILGAPGWFDPIFTNSKYKNEKIDFGRYIMTGGAPLFPHKHELYMKILKEKNSKCIVIPGYGLSEITAPAMINISDAYGDLGRPFPAIAYKIVDINTKQKVEPGQAGELWLRSTHEDLSPLAVGYLNNEEETKNTFVYDEGYRWVRTGDKVHENPDGSLKWEARYKNILTFNGFNIDCDKLLDKVSSIEGVGKAAIIGAITKDGNQRPIICFELKAGYPLDSADFVKEDIMNLIKEKLPDYYEPLDIVLYDKLPTKTMKINYNQLKMDNLNEFGEFIPSKTLKRGKEEF